VRPDVPEPIAAIVDRALSLSPEDRWPDAAEMRAALTTAAREAYGSVPGPADLALLFAKPGGLDPSDAVTQVAQTPEAALHHTPPPAADGFFRAVVQTTRGLGVDVDGVLERIGFDAKGTVPATSKHLVDFFEEAARASGDASLGVKVAFSLPLGASGALDYATRTSNTFGDAVQRMSKLYPFVSERLGLVIEEEGDRVHLVNKLNEGAPSGPQITECVTALFLVRAREALHSVVPLVSVGFRHARVPGGLDLAATFGAPVTYEAERDEIVLPRSVLYMRFETSDPLVADILERHTERLTKRPTG
jgi:hypothetical protein